MNKLLVLIRKNEEIVLYIFWGILTTIVSWGSYSVFIYLLNCLQFSEIFSVVISNIFSWVSATIFAFATNKIFVFKSKSWQRKVLIPEAIKFVSTRAFTGALELVLVPILVFMGLNQTIYGVQGMLSKVIVSVFVVILNYIFSKMFIFKSSLK